MIAERVEGVGPAIGVVGVGCGDLNARFGVVGRLTEVIAPTAEVNFERKNERTMASE
jgi:hypothetical protein